MAHRGLPPSLDRLEFQRFKVMLVVGGGGAAALLLLFLVGRDLVLSPVSPEEFAARMEQVGPRREVRELTDAWRAAQGFVEERILNSPLLVVEWPGGQHHEGHMGWYAFDGPVNVVQVNERVYKLYFEVHVARNAAGEWEREFLKIEPREGEAAVVEWEAPETP